MKIVYYFVGMFHIPSNLYKTVASCLYYVINLLGKILLFKQKWVEDIPISKYPQLSAQVAYLYTHQYTRNQMCFQEGTKFRERKNQPGKKRRPQLPFAPAKSYSHLIIWQRNSHITTQFSHLNLSCIPYVSLAIHVCPYLHIYVSSCSRHGFWVIISFERVFNFRRCSSKNIVRLIFQFKYQNDVSLSFSIKKLEEIMIFLK